MLRLFMLMKCSNSFSVADVLMSERDISFFFKNCLCEGSAVLFASCTHKNCVLSSD